MPGDQGFSSSVKLKSFHLSSFPHLYIKLRTVSANLILEFENSVFTPKFACVRPACGVAVTSLPFLWVAVIIQGGGRGTSGFPLFSGSSWFPGHLDIVLLQTCCELQSEPTLM